MKTTYAVKWREPDGQTYLGRLALGARTLRLDGRQPDGPAGNRQIGYEEILGLRIGTRVADRLDGQPALVVERADGRYLVTSAGIGAGVVQELVDRLAGLRGSAPRRSTVVVPLKPGALDAVRELVSRGPPFDPADTALTRHELLLTEHEAIFVFETPPMRAWRHCWPSSTSGRLRSPGATSSPARPAWLQSPTRWERPEPRILPAVGLGL